MIKVITLRCFFCVKKDIVFVFKKPFKNSRLVTLPYRHEKSIVKFDAYASFFRQIIDVCSVLSGMQAT
jgi:hypothetical protein